MLKQLSAYDGIVIFATNLINNYDPAFISRIRWKVNFELPDKMARAAIWRLQIPEQLPIDSKVDFDALASEFDNISGRDIKNAVFQAVVFAAKDTTHTVKKKVTQIHFREAILRIIESNKKTVLNDHSLKQVGSREAQGIEIPLTTCPAP